MRMRCICWIASTQTYNHVETLNGRFIGVFIALKWLARATQSQPFRNPELAPMATVEPKGLAELQAQLQHAIDGISRRLERLEYALMHPAGDPALGADGLPTSLPRFPSTGLSEGLPVSPSVATLRSSRSVQLPTNIVRINVGGRLFTTRLSTLCSVAGSFLDAMFSGRHAVDTDSDGNIFIDRNPAHFEVRRLTGAAACLAASHMQRHWGRCAGHSELAARPGRPAYDPGQPQRVLPRNRVLRSQRGAPA